MNHATPHPLAGKTVTLNNTASDPSGEVVPGVEYRIEDYWDRIAGMSWGDCNGNPACMKYAIRAGFASLPWDDEVVYGKIGPFGHLVHISELGEVVQ